MSSTLNPPVLSDGRVGERKPGLDLPLPRDRTRRNLRRHLEKTALRVLVLVSVDLGSVLVGRQVLRMVRTGLLGPAMAGRMASFLPQAAISGPELAVAVIMALFFLGCYRSGDVWAQPARIFTAAGSAVFVALYSDLWRGNTVVVVVRGLFIWMSLGLTLILLRRFTLIVARRLPRSAMVRHVLQIRGFQAEGQSLKLGRRYRVVGGLDPADLPDDIEDMEEWLERGVDTVLVSGELSVRHFGQVADFALSHGCQLLTAPRSRALVGMESTKIWLEGQELFELTAPSLRASQLIVKRIFDVVASTALILALGPLMFLIAVFIKLDSPGPVLFRHRRAGLGGRFFQLLKFRSMRPDAEQILFADRDLYGRYVANDFKLPEDEDPRVTRLGRLLRKSSLDELPQLFNVVRGDMSLIGPRPVVEPELEMYRGRIPTFLSVRPGVTGPWQISGRSDVPFPERADMDLEYVRHWSMLKDLWILLMTLPVVVIGKGAH